LIGSAIRPRRMPALTVEVHGAARRAPGTEPRSASAKSWRQQSRRERSTVQLVARQVEQQRHRGARKRRHQTPGTGRTTEGGGSGYPPGTTTCSILVRFRPAPARARRWCSCTSAAALPRRPMGDPGLGGVHLGNSRGPPSWRWSEMTSGSSTPRWRARSATRIQPLAIAARGSAGGELQRSFSG